MCDGLQPFPVWEVDQVVSLPVTEIYGEVGLCGSAYFVSEFFGLFLDDASGNVFAEVYGDCVFAVVE